MTYVRAGVEYRSYGEYLRGKGVRIAYTNSANGWDATKQKRWDNELASYRAALAEGLNPAGTTHREIDAAKRAADAAA